MATPPPEAAPVMKEDKPQLPPSPTGASAPEVAPNSDPAVTPDIKTDLTENRTTTMNGNTPHSSIANGTGSAASPPKSPVTDVPGTMPTSSAPTHTPPSSALPAPQETKVPEETATPTPTLSQAQATESVTPAATNGSAEKSNANTPQTSAIPSTASMAPGALDGSNDAMVTDAPEEPSAAPVKTELPLHPSTESATPSLPPLQTDHEMRDAPLSPSKMSREREIDPAEEPAAKRAKVENEDGKPAINKSLELPTPATETAGPVSTGNEAPMTKMQHKFITKQISSLKRMHDSRFYRTPVDPIAMNIPNYPSVITRPMDLGTIEKKLKANEYATPQAVMDDFALMVQNAHTFNGADHLVSQEGAKLLAAFQRQMNNLPKADEVEEKKKPKKATEKTSAARREPRTSLTGQSAAPVPTIPAPAVPAPKATSPQSATFALGPEGLPVIRRDSANADGRPKRSIHPPKRDLPYSTKPKKKKYQWELRFCQEVLEELYKPKHAVIAMAFYYPVDPVALNIPTYHSVIKHPMDLSTIKAKLSTGQYENAKEFHSDVKLMFKNCYRFNLEGDPTYLAGKSLEEVFDKKWSGKQEYLAKHEPPQEHNSESSEEDSEEEAEESDEDMEKITMLQRQIAEMSRQVEMIQKKKKTPPAKKGSKSGKSGAKKEIKKSSGKKDKKSKSFSKVEKTRNISYHEKQIISNGISSLPDKKMQEALGIIQQNVPALKGTQEAEIELDIDELPNEVLLMLLKFVKKNVPHIMDDEEPLPVGGNVAPAAPKPKKNKPMSKYEQEAQINMLESNLSRFQGGSGSPAPMPSVEANESSDDESDDDSEESEEE
ncbi:Bromodomain-containing factor 1 [Penicillium rolfsii]|nr:Bromodomain-containing factor 1 [Penicillium rolfsii]